MRRANSIRLAVYAVGFAVALAIDPLTPLGEADWLLELILVGVACVWGLPRETYVVAAIGSVTLAIGLWTSPPGAELPFWVAALNRIVAIVAIWSMVYVARQRRNAEAARRRAAEQVKVLQGLLPICSVCKAIRGASGEWSRLETYLLHHSSAQLSHTFCPQCAKKAMADLEHDVYPGPAAGRDSGQAS